MKINHKSSLFYAFSLIGLLLIMVFGCKKEDLAELAKLGSLTVTEISSSSVKVTARVENSGGVNVTSRGMVWGTSENPDVDSYGGKTAVGSGTGEFVTTITGLSPFTKHYLRAFATNSEGTAYSSQIEFTTLAGTSVVVTSAATGITENSAVSGGEVSDDGGIEITSRGVVWGTEEEPDIDKNDGITEDGDGTGEFTSELTSLSPATKYYIRAYATNSTGTVYGSQVEFTTLAGTALVTTAEVTSITESSAVSGGEVTDDGGLEVTSRGVVWGTESEPDIDENDGITEDGDGIGEFTSELTSLSPATKYYVRAYATNSTETVYGSQVEFTTLAGTAVVTTAEVTGITENSAVSGGEVTDDGGIEVTARGVVWSTEAEPDIDENDGFTDDGDGIGKFTSELTGLSPGTKYYVRAYATNSIETVYGSQVDFNTLAAVLPEITTAAVTAITDNSAVAGGNVVSDGGAQVTERGVVWSTFQDPSLENNDGKMNEGTGTGVFSVDIQGLYSETTYYVRAFATNSEGTAYGDEVQFTTIDYPEVSTELVTGFTDVSASIRGRVLADGGATSTRGIVWSTFENPTVENNEGKSSTGTGTGFFTGNATGLNTGTTYFVRAWAENSAGVSYGGQVELTTYDGRVVDIDENVYFYEVIGEQEWMVSNLKTTRLNNGTSLLHVTDNLDWAYLHEDEDPAYCFYDNYGEKFKDVFGALYNYYAVETEMLCPTGWRVPTGADVDALVTHAGGNLVAAGKLKGINYWQDSANPGTDEYRFNALPGGMRYPHEGDFPGQFDGLNKFGSWWTSTTYEIGAYTYGMSYLWVEIFAADVRKEAGVSVRCMRGDPPTFPPIIIGPM